METELESPARTETQDSPETRDQTEPARPRSKIARLPKATREKLNQFLDEGFRYREVLEKLGEEGKHLNETDISRWMHAGHQVWLKHQSWLDHVTSSFENAKDLVSEGKAFSIHEANLHIAATTMHETMVGCDMTALPNLLKEKPENLFALLSAIPRFAQQALNFQKHREACANARAELQKLRDPSRNLSDDERRAIVDKVDEILGLK